MKKEKNVKSFKMIEFFFNVFWSHSHWLYLLIWIDFLWVIPDGNEAGVEMWITSAPLCFSVVSLPLPIPLSHSSVPLNHIYSHFHLHHLIIKHPRLHFLKWSQSHSASCVRLSLLIPPDKLGCWHTVKNESHRVSAQILMWGTTGGDGGSIKTHLIWLW